MKNVLATLCVLSALVVQSPLAESFDRRAHQAMSERAVASSSLGRYLTDQLGFPQGSAEQISDGANRQEVTRWIRDGAEFEDIPSVRVRHHFHNPTRPWDQAGLRVAGAQIGESSVLWGQDRGQTIGGKHSWHDARTSFVRALAATTDSERQKAYTETFRSLGQLMHLIQDAASPAHTRNDAHLCCLLGVGDRDEFHDWAEVAGNRNRALSLPSQRFAQSILTGPPFNPLAPVPIARILDTERYRQTGVPEAGLDIGLAEYSSANFFSDDTIFSDLPFPAPSSVVLGEPEFESKTREFRRYFKKAGDGELIDHLAVSSGLYEFLPEPLKGRKKGLDDKVLQDYAAKLFPRAVGYSAGLIDYFFRGQLAIEPVDQTHLRVVNLSAEALVSGTMEIFYDKVTGERVPLTEAQMIAGPISPGQPSQPITFELPTDNGTPGRYWAVFRGQLGDEVGAVIGAKGFLWAEEWDQGLNGRHPWYYTALDTTVAPPVYGVRDAQVVDTPSATRLRMRNMRPAGVPGSQIGNEPELFQGNAAWLGYTSYPSGTDPADHYDAFPMQVLPETELQIKVAALSATFPTPLQQCLVAPYESWHNGAFQQIVIIVNYGAYVLELTVPGQQADTRKVGPSDGLLVVTPGQEQQINLWQALRDSGAPVDQQAMVISSIRMDQIFLPSCQTTTADQEQIMEIDYLRFVDVPPTAL